MVSTKIVVIGAVVVLAATGLILGLVLGLQNDDPEKEDNNEPGEDLVALNPPYNMRLEEHVDDLLKLSWSDDDEVDGKYYRIVTSYSYDNKVYSTHTTEDTFYFINKPVVCTGVKIDVSSVAPLYKESEPITRTYNTSKCSTPYFQPYNLLGRDPIVVSNFKVSEENGVLKTEWEYPRFPLVFCNIEDIEYEVKVGLQYWHTRGFQLLLEGYRDFKPCKKVDVLIVLIIDYMRVASTVTETYEIALPDNFGAGFQYTAIVQSVDDDYFISMTWELDDIGYCAIEYVVSCFVGNNPAIEEQISTPSYEFRSCPIIQESGQYITVTIQPRLPGESPGSDRDGQARICEFYAKYESASWELTGDCIPHNKEQRLVDDH